MSDVGYTRWQSGRLLRFEAETSKEISLSTWTVFRIDFCSAWWIIPCEQWHSFSSIDLLVWLFQYYQYSYECEFFIHGEFQYCLWKVATALRAVKVKCWFNIIIIIIIIISAETTKQLVAMGTDKWPPLSLVICQVRCSPLVLFPSVQAMLWPPHLYYPLSIVLVNLCFLFLCWIPVHYIMPYSTKWPTSIFTFYF